MLQTQVLTYEYFVNKSFNPKYSYVSTKETEYSVPGTCMSCTSNQTVESQIHDCCVFQKYVCVMVSGGQHKLRHMKITLSVIKSTKFVRLAFGHQSCCCQRIPVPINFVRSGPV